MWDLLENATPAWGSAIRVTKKRGPQIPIQHQSNGYQGKRHSKSLSTMAVFRICHDQNLHPCQALWVCSWPGTPTPNAFHWPKRTTIAVKKGGVILILTMLPCTYRWVLHRLANVWLRYNDTCSQIMYTSIQDIILSAFLWITVCVVSCKICFSSTFQITIYL